MVPPHRGNARIHNYSNHNHNPSSETIVSLIKEYLKVALNLEHD
jgi:hypothetical protein